jgi:hypothetical protein
LVISLRKAILRNSTSAPFISGDAIAKLAEYSPFGIAGDRSPDINYVKSANSLFVVGHKLEEFLDRFSNVITARVLITGNSDQNFTLRPMLPSSIKLWLCQNNAMNPDPLIRTLPIGLENLRLGRAGLTHFHRNPNFPNLVNRILVPPMSPTNREREIVIRHAFRNPDLFDVKTEYLTEKKYFSLVKRYQFVFCSEGNGFENHRIWETLYQGSFPIMLKTTWSESLKWLKLPILLVASLEELTLETLEEFIQMNQNVEPKNHDALWIPFWKNLID